MKHLMHLHQAQLARLAVDDGEHDDAEADLQLRVLIEVVEHHLGLLAALQLDDDAHAVAVAVVQDVARCLRCASRSPSMAICSSSFDLFTW